MHGLRARAPAPQSRRPRPSRPWGLTFTPAILLLLGLMFLSPQAAFAEGSTQVPVQTFELDNGMRFLVVTKPEMTTVAAGWVAHVGSSNERPGITGISHFFEHMMFKGTHTVGTKNIERDLEIIARQEEIQERIRRIYRDQRRRARLGEIEDPYAAEARTEELIALEADFNALVQEQREVMIKDEFDQIYTEAGGSRMNAFTNRDITGYFITVPANKLELWFWMESDRLSNPVFREFYSERDVVYEERRLRTESTPTGKFDELFDALFWEAHPYSWPVVGWPSDLRVYTKAQADEYYATYYAPNNLTGILVGNFQLEDAKKYAETYFGRIPRGKVDPPDVVTLELEQIAEKRMNAECDCQPQINIRYHTVPFMHTESYALDVLGGLLSGRTGRLHKSMVLGSQIAASTHAGQNSMKWAGSFDLYAEARGDATPADLEQALLAEIEKIIEQPIPEEELQKVKNQITASSFRRLQSPFFLLIQLIIYDGMGDWTYLNTWADKTLAVTTDDVKEVAKKYLTKENRSVAHYDRKEGSVAEVFPKALDSLPDGLKQAAKNQIRHIRSEDDVEGLQAMLAELEASRDQIPEQIKPMIAVIEPILRERIAELERASSDESDAGEGGTR